MGIEPTNTGFADQRVSHFATGAHCNPRRLCKRERGAILKVRTNENPPHGVRGRGMYNSIHLAESRRQHLSRLELGRGQQLLTIELYFSVFIETLSVRV